MLSGPRIFKKIKKNLFPDPEKQNYARIWRKLIRRHRRQWRQKAVAGRTGPKVLIATSTGGLRAVTPVESTIAAALHLRECDVHFLLCDEFLPACSQADSKIFDDVGEFVRGAMFERKCPRCFRKGRAIYEALDRPIHRYSELVSEDDLRRAESLATSVSYHAIPEFQLDGLAVGEHALAGALRFFAKGNLDDEPLAEPVLRRFFQAALLTTFALRTLLHRIRFDCAVFHHGIYVPQGLIGEVARQEQVRVVNWIPAYRKRCFIFSHGDTYHHTLISEPMDRWESMQWNDATEAELMDYLQSRWRGTRDWISFHRDPQFEVAAIAAEVGIDFSRPCIGMLTNVMWDAQLHYPANAFPNMLEWVWRTISYFAERPDLQLLIRVHPAEITGVIPSRQAIVTEIAKRFPQLPDNVFVIPPESRISTYVAMQHCDSVIIYGTKTGVELTSMGIPVIVAGEAWIRGKGITTDAESVADYLRILDGLPLGKRLAEATIERARKYAYHFFFRRMIPLPFMQPTGGRPPNRLALKNLKELLPGRSPGLDVICAGIIDGSDFIYRAEAAVDTANLSGAAQGETSSTREGG